MQRGDNTESGAPSSVLAVKPADGVEARSADSAVRDFILLHRNTVPYVSQSYSWDCGLACAEMALRARGFEKVTIWELRRMCSTHSVWSIDIAYLLHSYRVDTTFFTVTRGVRPEYHKQEFYRRQLAEDTKRVNELFENADKNGVKVIQRPVQLSDIRRAVQEKQMLVLVLMDKRVIRCCMCDRSGSAQRQGLFSACSSSGFLGHYILLYAYNAHTDKFLMKDPASLRETCVIAADVLEEARVAYGTDQDILFIGQVSKRPRAVACHQSSRNGECMP